MDITALLNPYSRNDGASSAIDEPLEAAVTDFADAIEEIETVAPATELDIDSLAVFEEIAEFDSIDTLDAADLAPVETRVVGRHRAEVPTDSVSPLVPVAATHRLSA